MGEREELLALIEEHLEECDEEQLANVLSFLSLQMVSESEEDLDSEELESEEEYDRVVNSVVELNPEQQEELLNRIKNVQLPPL